MIDTRELVISRSQLHKRELPYGFKAKAKRRSLEVRIAAGFADDDPLDCDRLALHLGITIVRMSELEPNQHTYHPVLESVVMLMIMRSPQPTAPMTRLSPVTATAVVMRCQNRVL